MARKDALLKLHKQLQSRRRELLHSIADELGDMGHARGGRAGSDDVDVAADAVTTEMNSHLAEIESRELAQINRALAKLKDGSYGICEGCEKRIPVQRLNALPYATVCIECQREMENHPADHDDFESGWHKVYDRETASRDVSSVKVSDLEMRLR